MNLNKLLITLMCFCFAGTVLAGPGKAGHSHAHEKPAIKKEKVEGRALVELKRLLNVKKIDEKWASIVKAKSVEKKQYGAKWEWMVVFENPELEEKKMLYIFLKPSGDFVAANHNGK